MIALASGLRVYLACEIIDKRTGMTELAMLVVADPGRGFVRRRGVCRPWPSRGAD